MSPSFDLTRTFEQIFGVILHSWYGTLVLELLLPSLALGDCHPAGVLVEAVVAELFSV